MKMTNDALQMPKQKKKHRIIQDKTIGETHVMDEQQREADEPCNKKSKSGAHSAEGDGS